MGASAPQAATTQRRGEGKLASRPKLSRDVALRRLLGLGDALAVLLALDLALFIPGRSHRIWLALLCLPLMIVLFKVYGLYDRDMKRISHSTVDELPWLLHAIVIGVLLFWLFARYTSVRRLDLEEIALLSGGMALLVPAVRVAIRRIAVRFIGQERALLVGHGRMTDMLVRKLRGHPEYQVEVIGALATGSRREQNSPIEILGGVEELSDLVQRHGVTRVLIAPGDLGDSELDELLKSCRGLSLRVSILPRLSDMLGPAVEIDDVEGITVLGLSPPQLPRSSRAIKRAIDIVVSMSLLLISSPVLLVVSLAIKLDSRGPVLFSQERIGQGGRRFRLYKLRTMVADAESRREALLTRSIDPNWLFLHTDPRITRVGKWLRRLSLDELPQLWNVLRGEMSMVGPRPLIPAEDERVQHWARGRLDLTPGITGYWQVLGRTRIPFEEMVKLDYLYVMNWSLWQDFRLMLRTLPAVILGRGGN